MPDEPIIINFDLGAPRCLALRWRNGAEKELGIPDLIVRDPAAIEAVHGGLLSIALFSAQKSWQGLGVDPRFGWTAADVASHVGMGESEVSAALTMLCMSGRVIMIPGPETRYIPRVNIYLSQKEKRDDAEPYRITKYGREFLCGGNLLVLPPELRRVLSLVYVPDGMSNKTAAQLDINGKRPIERLSKIAFQIRKKLEAEPHNFPPEVSRSMLFAKKPGGLFFCNPGSDSKKRN